MGKENRIVTFNRFKQFKRKEGEIEEGEIEEGREEEDRYDRRRETKRMACIESPPKSSKKCVFLFISSGLTPTAPPISCLIIK
mmetsp:Transcript_18109/g.28349  ORF Transcript_18109/g.28349 Transcript_18109/m.28349 type:complete len:83 (-) Transcript_18109:363-611(-)